MRPATIYLYLLLLKLRININVLLIKFNKDQHIQNVMYAPYVIIPEVRMESEYNF